MAKDQTGGNCSGGLLSGRYDVFEISFCESVVDVYSSVCVEADDGNTEGVMALRIASSVLAVAAAFGACADKSAGASDGPPTTMPVAVQRVDPKPLPVLPKGEVTVRRYVLVKAPAQVTQRLRDKYGYSPFDWYEGYIGTSTDGYDYLSSGLSGTERSSPSVRVGYSITPVVGGTEIEGDAWRIIGAFRVSMLPDGAVYLLPFQVALETRLIPNLQPPYAQPQRATIEWFPPRMEQEPVDNIGEAARDLGRQTYGVPATQPASKPARE